MPAEKTKPTTPATGKLSEAEVAAMILRIKTKK